MPDAGIGTNLREIRERRGLTQTQLSERSGVSVPTIKALEQHPERGAEMNTLRKLATAMGVHTSDLLRTRRPALVTDDVERATALIGMRQVLGPVPHLGPTVVEMPVEAPTLQKLREDTASAARDYHRDAYDTLLLRLPNLILAGRALVSVTSGHEHDQANVALATGLRVAGRALKQVGEPDLAVAALHQAITAAQHASDVNGAARATSMLADVYMRQRRFGDAADMCVTAADAVRPRNSDPTARVAAGWGSLLLSAAAASARDGRDEVDDILAEAGRAARLVGSPSWSQDESPATFGDFSLARVEMISAECAMVQDRPDAVISHANRVSRTTPVAPSTMQRHRLDVARAHVRAGRRTRAEQVLDEI